MKMLWIFVLTVLSSIAGYAANPSFDTFDTNDFNVVRNPPHISLNHSLLSATNIYATNLYTTINISSNLYATNFYATNIFATNITATNITNNFATINTTIINTLTANYFYAYSYIVNTNYGIWTNDNSAYPYSIVHILDEIPYSYVAMSNTLIKGTESVLSKSQTLVLGTNVLESGTRSQFLLISPTNDAAQVVIELNGGTNTVQKLEIYNLTNAIPALGAFTLVANSAIPDSLVGGLVKLREGQNWVATNGAWIELRFVSPDWIEIDRGTLATSGTGGTTINPSNLYLPVRSSTNAFADSPIHVPAIGSTNATLDGQLTADGLVLTNAGAGSTPLTINAQSSQTNFLSVNAGGTNYFNADLNTSDPRLTVTKGGNYLRAGVGSGVPYLSGDPYLELLSGSIALLLDPTQTPDAIYVSSSVSLGMANKPFDQLYLTNNTSTNYIYFGTNVMSVTGSDLYWNGVKLN